MARRSPRGSRSAKHLSRSILLKSLPIVLAIYCFIFCCVQYGYTAYNGKSQFFGIEVYGGSPDGADLCETSAAGCSEQQNAYNHDVQVAGGSTDLIYNAVGYIFSWTLPFLVHKIGAKWIVTLSLIPQTLLMVMAFSDIVALDVFIVVVTSPSQNVVFALLVPVIVHFYGDKVDIGVYVDALNSANCVGQLLNLPSALPSSRLRSATNCQCSLAVS